MPAKKWLTISRKTSKKFFNISKIIFSIVILIIGIYGIYGIFSGDYFKINNINCQENGFPCSNILVSSEINGKNIFLLDINDLKRKIKNDFPFFQTIDISKKLPDKIIIKLISSLPQTALTKNQHSWYLVNEQGLLYKQIFQKPQNLPEIIIEKSDYPLYIGLRLNDNKILTAISLANEMKQNMIPFKQVIFDSTASISVKLFEPIIASFSAEKSIFSQLDSLQFILRQSKIEGKLPVMIDLRFSKPVVRY